MGRVLDFSGSQEALWSPSWMSPSMIHCTIVGVVNADNRIAVVFACPVTDSVGKWIDPGTTCEVNVRSLTPLGPIARALVRKEAFDATRDA